MLLMVSADTKDVEAKISYESESIDRSTEDDTAGVLRGIGTELLGAVAENRVDSGRMRQTYAEAQADWPEEEIDQTVVSEEETAETEPVTEAATVQPELVVPENSIYVITAEDYDALLRIVEDETTVFAYKMEGATLEADWWMTNKLAASRLTGMSSLRALTASRAGELEASWKVREENFFVCGGCIPVFMRDGSRPFAYVMVSGMEHWDDHQVIADAMAKQLGVEIPEVQKEQP